MIKRIYIEITNICNLRCAFCVPGNRKREIMTADRFRIAAEQAKKITDYIYLHVQGEPMSHPEFEKIMQICDELQMKVQLVTNGSFLAKYPDLTSHTSPRKVSISLQSLPFQNTDIETYMDNVISLCMKASEQGHPYVELRFWRMDQISHPSEKRALERIRETFGWEKTGRRNSILLRPYVYLSYDNSFEWPESEEYLNVRVRGYCHGAIDQIAVLSCGDVTPCCLDCSGNICFGNLFEEQLSDILQKERYVTMVENLKNRVIVEPFCVACDFRKRFK